MIKSLALLDRESKLNIDFRTLMVQLEVGCEAIYDVPESEYIG